MLVYRASFFDGVSIERIRELLGHLDECHFEPGAAVIAWGETPHLLHVIVSGQAEVLVRDRFGREQHVNHLGPGDTLGEMPILTGSPSTTTVRAETPLHTIVLSEADFERATEAYPRLYRNMLTTMAQALSRGEHHAVRGDPTPALLLDGGAPPLLGYALASSIAWHTRGSVLLVVVGGSGADPHLAHLATDTIDPMTLELRDTPERDRRPGGARLALVPQTGAFVPERLAETIGALCGGFDQLLVQVPAAEPPAGYAGRAIRIGVPGSNTPPLPQPGYSLHAWTEPVRILRPQRDGIVRIPPLTTQDERALRDGRLPNRSAAGRSLGWVARHLAGLQVGLALGGGSAKGYTHLGVLRVLERAGVPVDYLAGTSIGSVVGAAYAMGYSLSETAGILDRVGAHAFRLTLPINSLLSSRGIRASARRLTRNMRIEDLNVPFAVVAADIVAREEIVFRKGLLWPALLASTSLPGIYPVQRMGNRLLVDGGVINPIPSSVVSKMGADVVLGVTLASRAAPGEAMLEATATMGRLPTAYEALMRSLDVLSDKVSAEMAEEAAILIDPEFPPNISVPLRRFSAGRRFIPLGEAAAEAALPRIATALPWLRGEEN